MTENKYRAWLKRGHESATTTLKLDDHEFVAPLHQHVVVDFETDLDAFAATEQELVDAAVTKVQADATLPDVGWSQWQMSLVQERYEFGAPAPLRLNPDSHAGKCLQAYLDAYPTLVGHDEFAPYCALEQWFCTIGNGLEWCNGKLIDRFYPGFAPAASLEDHANARAWEDEYRASAFSRSLLPRPPVKLYPLSQGYSLLFDVPEDVEDGYFVAAMQLCEYLLSRPVWQNYAYTPDELTERQPSRRSAVWTTQAWRHVALADGAKYRTIVHEAYARLVLGPWRRRMSALGFEDKGFFPLNYELPPNARRFHD